MVTITPYLSHPLPTTSFANPCAFPSGHGKLLQKCHVRPKLIGARLHGPTKLCLYRVRRYPPWEEKKHTVYHTLQNHPPCFFTPVYQHTGGMVFVDVVVYNVHFLLYKKKKNSSYYFTCGGCANCGNSHEATTYVSLKCQPSVERLT